MAHFGSVSLYQGVSGAPYLNVDAPGNPFALDSVLNSPIAGGLVNITSVQLFERGFARPSAPADSVTKIDGSIVPTAPGLFSCSYAAGSFDTQVLAVGNSVLIVMLAVEDTVPVPARLQLVILDDGSATLTGNAPVGANGILAFTVVSGTRVYESL